MDSTVISEDGEKILVSDNITFFEKGKAHVYTGMGGDFYISPHYRKMVNIDGHVRTVKNFIKEGKLEGAVWQNLHSECYIVPRLHKEGEKVEMIGLMECCSPNCYRMLNNRHDVPCEIVRFRR
jgi:hypothetical protein|tara:strand:- start:1105 stop:1473 length:369 start_codon:yes stop_codon:yes gene_type:complete